MDKIQKLKKIIDESYDIVFFGGAGVSTESNIKDFRSKDGLYNMKYNYPPEEILSHHFFLSHPHDFYNFFREYLNPYDYKPNIVHDYLYLLEKEGKLKAIITQNIDNLHKIAGSKNVLELHGNATRAYCLKCGKKYNKGEIFATDEIPRCQCGGIIKPDVVLYEENLDAEVMEEAINVISKADTLIVAGTSLKVYPAAGFLKYFTGKNLIILNKEVTPFDGMATLVIHDKLGKIISELQEH